MTQDASTPITRVVRHLTSRISSAAPRRRRQLRRHVPGSAALALGRSALAALLGAKHVTAGRSRLGALVAAALLTTCAALVAPVAALADEPVFLAKWGSSGDGDGQFAFPTGVATDAAGNVYVADQNNHNIQRFDSTGTFLAKWGSSDERHGRLDCRFGVATDAERHV